MNILLFASAWGPLHGGINSFNMDLAIGMARVVGPGGRVFCAIPPFTNDEEAAARAENVSLIALPITGEDLDKKVHHQVEQRVLDFFDVHLQKTSIDLWIGHDTITGPLAAAAARHFACGRLALIHHMDYSEYKGYAAGAPASLAEQQQRMLFSTQGAHLFAVGPYLRQSCIRLSGVADVTMIIPGFPAIQPIPDDGTALRAIVTGRLDPRHDRLKQGILAVNAIGAAVNSAEVANLHGHPRLTIIGIDCTEDGDQLIRAAEQRAGRVVNVEPIPFSSDRQALLDRVRRSNLALMLSWHEGFGLTGWEAIAAGVPLILSRHSGLYQLIESTDWGAALPFVEVIDVQGSRGGEELPNFTDQDLENVRLAIVRRAANLARSRAQALRLRQFLVEEHVCTWEHAARTLLRASGLLSAPSSLPGRPLATSAEIQIALGELFGDNPWFSYAAEQSLSVLSPPVLIVEFSAYMRELSTSPPLQDSMVRAARVFGRTGERGIAMLMDVLRSGSWLARLSVAPLFRHLPREEAAEQLFPRLSSDDMDEVRFVIEALGWIGRWQSAYKMTDLIGLHNNNSFFPFKPAYPFEKLSSYVLRAHALTAALSIDSGYAVESIDFYLKLLSECKVLDKGRLESEWDNAAPLFESRNANHLRSWIDEDELRIDLYLSIILHKRFVWALLDMVKLAAREDLSTGIRKRALRAMGMIGTRQAAAELLHLLLETAAGSGPSWNEVLNQEAYDAMAAMLHHLTDLEFDQLPRLRHYTSDRELVAAITNRKRITLMIDFPARLASLNEEERGLSALCSAIMKRQKAQALLREFLANAPTTFDRFFLLLSLVRAGAPEGLLPEIERAVDPRLKQTLRGFSYFWRREIVFTLSLVSLALATAWADTLFVDLQACITEARLIENATS